MYTRNLGATGMTPVQTRDYAISQGWITMSGDVINPSALYSWATANGLSNADIDNAMLTTTRFTSTAEVAPVNDRPDLPSRYEMDPRGEWNVHDGDIYDPTLRATCGGAPSPGLTPVLDRFGGVQCRWTDSVQAALQSGAIRQVNGASRFSSAPPDSTAYSHHPTASSTMPSAAPTTTATTVPGTPVTAPAGSVPSPIPTVSPIQTMQTESEVQPPSESVAEPMSETDGGASMPSSKALMIGAIALGALALFGRKR